MPRGSRFIRTAFLTVVGILGVLSIVAKNGGDVSIAYDTSCGNGVFGFEPYPATAPPGVALPSYHTSDADASCVSPGGTLSAWPITNKYPDLVSITKIELVIYHMRLLEAYDGSQYWHGKQDPEYYALSYSVAGNPVSVVEVDIPPLTGLPPTAADIRMTYLDDNGYTREVLFEDGRGNLSDHKLFFVPEYSLNLARRRVDIGWDVNSRTMTGRLNPLMSPYIPRGWETYCQLFRASIYDHNFPGTAKFWDTAPSRYNPGHAYHVEMPAATEGYFHFQYTIICPKGMQPTGSSYFTSWGVLGDHDGSMISGGLPRYEGVTYPPDSWHPPEHPNN